MPRLNLIHDISYRDREYYFRYSYETIEECDLPFRISMRKTHTMDRWGYKWSGCQRVDGVNVYKLIGYILDANIGKSFDLTFSYYTKKTRGMRDNHYWFFNNFEGRYPYYEVDEQGLIQKIHSNHRYRQRTALKDFKSFDYREEIVHRETGEIWEPCYFKKPDYNWETKVLSGYVIPMVQPNSNQWRRLTAEKNQASKRNERLLKKQKQEKEYCFLTKSEIELISSRIDDQENLERHGFDSESFRGYHYHGRKNKRKWN